MGGWQRQLDEHIRNLEQMIRNYQTSIDDEGVEPRNDVGINVGTNVGINEQRVLELIQMNNRITAKELAISLSVSLRQSERIMATLKEKGLYFARDKIVQGLFQFLSVLSYYFSLERKVIKSSRLHRMGYFGERLRAKI